MPPPSSSSVTTVNEGLWQQLAAKDSSTELNINGDGSSDQSGSNAGTLVGQPLAPGLILAKPTDRLLLMSEKEAFTQEEVLERWQFRQYLIRSGNYQLLLITPPVENKAVVITDLYGRLLEFFNNHLWLRRFFKQGEIGDAKIGYARGKNGKADKTKVCYAVLVTLSPQEFFSRQYGIIKKNDGKEPPEKRQREDDGSETELDSQLEETIKATAISIENAKRVADVFYGSSSNKKKTAPVITVDDEEELSENETEDYGQRSYEEKNPDDSDFEEGPRKKVNRKHQGKGKKVNKKEEQKKRTRKSKKN